MRKADAGTQNPARIVEAANAFKAPGTRAEWPGIGRALWGRARSGCGAAIVGDPDQVLARLEAYRAEGIQASILSGDPHSAEVDPFARPGLPRLDTGLLTAPPLRA